MIVPDVLGPFIWGIGIGVICGNLITAPKTVVVIAMISTVAGVLLMIKAAIGSGDKP